MSRGRRLRPVILWSAALALWSASLALAQNPQDTTTFETRVNVVLVPVVVRDPAGHAIGNLTKDDFAVFDKGKRQIISSFSVIEHALAPAHNDAHSEATGTLTPTRPTAAGATQPERYIVYVFDDLNPLFEQLVPLREAARRYFKSGIPAADRVAISTFSGRGRVPFTSDAGKLEEAAAKIRLQPRMGHGPGAPCPDVSYYLADLIINRDDHQALDAVTQQTIECAHVDKFTAERLAESEARRELLIGALDTEVALETLRRAIRQLAQMPGERLIVLSSRGFYTPPGDTRNMTSVLDQAARAHVGISALDPSGVYSRDLMDASRRRPASSLEQGYYRQSARAATDVLSDLAEGTGGIFFHNNNDLTAGFARAAAAPEYSYVLGFSPALLKTDGSYHRLKIRLVNSRNATLQTRRGYYALKPASAEETAAAEVHDAVFSQDEISDIPVDVAMQVSKSGAENARLTVLAKVHLTWLHFRKIADRSRGSLTVISAVFDPDGGYVVGARKTVNLALRDETLASDDPGVNVQSDFAVKPGRYRVRVVVHETGGRELSAYNRTVTIR